MRADGRPPGLPSGAESGFGHRFPVPLALHMCEGGASAWNRSLLKTNAYSLFVHPNTREPKFSAIAPPNVVDADTRNFCPTLLLAVYGVVAATGAVGRTSGTASQCISDCRTRLLIRKVPENQGRNALLVVSYVITNLSLRTLNVT